MLESWCRHFSWQSIMGPLLVIESTSCYRKHLLLSRLPLVIGNTSCYRDYLLLSETPLVIETTSGYRKRLLLSRLPLVIGDISCYREHFLLSKGIFVRLRASITVFFPLIQIHYKLIQIIRVWKQDYGSVFIHNVVYPSRLYWNSLIRIWELIQWYDANTKESFR